MNEVWREISTLKSIVQSFDIKNVQQVQAHVLRQGQVCKDHHEEISTLKQRQTDLDDKLANFQLELERISTRLDQFEQQYNFIHAHARHLEQWMETLSIQTKELTKRMPSIK